MLFQNAGSERCTGLLLQLLAQNGPQQRNNGQQNEEEGNGTGEEDREAALGKQKRTAHIAFEHGPENQGKDDRRDWDFKIDKEVADYQNDQHCAYIKDIIAQSKGTDDAQHENDGRQDVGLDMNDLDKEANSQKAENQEKQIGDQRAGKDIVYDHNVLGEERGAGLKAVKRKCAHKDGGGCVAGDYENIYVVDSGSAAIGGGILTELALQLRENGLGAKEIAERLEEEKGKVLLVALVDTLEYLKKGGRISKTAAFAGAVLNIKPVIAVADGEIRILGKARGSKMGNNLLVQEMEKAGGVDFSKPVLLGYTGLSDALLRKYIEDSKRLWETGLEHLRYTTVGSVIGTHAGPGAIAVAFFRN